MKKTIIALIVALFLLIAGGALCAVSLVAIRFDPEQLSTVTFREETIEPDGSFQDIRVKAGVEDVRIIPSADPVCRVKFRDPETVTHEVRTENNTLFIETENTGKWYDQFGFFANEPLIEVYVPGDTYGSLQTQINTGALEITGLHFDGDLTLSSVTGDVRFSDVTCRNLVSDSNTGDLDLSDVIASGDMNLSRNTGDIRLEDSDAAGFTVSTNTGDVTGTLLTGKQFIARSTTGDIDVPADTEGGRFEVTTVSGDIELEVRGN
jgi:hypothetical protein